MVEGGKIEGQDNGIMCRREIGREGKQEMELDKA